jgi:hypothetical protein
LAEAAHDEANTTAKTAKAGVNTAG